MENIIDETFFWGDLEIPNLLLKNNSTVADAMTEKKISDFRSFISKHQSAYLKNMFGDSLSVNIPESLLAALADHDLKTSPIANFVYYHFQRSKQLTTTSTGEKQVNTVNSTALYNPKLVRAWNEMVDLNKALYRDIYDGVISGIEYDADIKPIITTETLPLFEYMNDLGV